MLFNEPKLLKSRNRVTERLFETRFSALQRAEIAEILIPTTKDATRMSFSALQRAEIAEIPA